MISKKNIGYLLVCSLFLIIICSSFLVQGANSSYIPTSPAGNNSGVIDEDIEFSITSSEIGAYWMFDWDDGTYSEWIEVIDSNSKIVQTHSWNTEGTYNIRVKHRTDSLIESQWSEPLVVTISLPTDNDSDGYNNDLEIVYGSNPDDADSKPLDTDSDGIPDETINDFYVGDIDDDGDGLFDEIENIIGSNSKNDQDVLEVIIDSSIYYIVETSEDINKKILFNPRTEEKSIIKYEDGQYKIDINGDKKTDYLYNDGVITPYTDNFEIPWLIIITIAVLLILVILFILIKTGIIYFYEEEVIVDE